MKMRKVAFTLVPIRDTARARAFYEGVLGLEPGLQAGDGMWTEYDLPEGGCIALFRDPSGKSTPSVGAGSMVAIEVSDLDGWIADLQAKGVEFQAKLIPSPVCRMSIVVDPEGNGLMLHELRPKDGAQG